MNRVLAPIGAAFAVAVFSGCAALKPEDVRIYEPTQLRAEEYETVGRLWVENWRARTWVPMYSSREDGIAALQDKAAQLGANGVINVGCYPDPGMFSLGSESFLCYAKAIKVR